jgi:hypothetical protein
MRAALAVVWLSFMGFGVARATEYPWVLIYPQNDSRDPEMRRADEAYSRNMVSVVNQTERLFHHHVVWKKAAISHLLEISAPFCEMHFDAVHPFEFTPEEKTIVAEYFKRGGFILFFIDAYPYDQDEFWAVKHWPLVDFLTEELSRGDTAFSSSRIPDSDPIFQIHYPTHPPDSIVHELRDNPSTPNRTAVYYKGQMRGIVMGDYYIIEGGKWVAEPRPFSLEFSSELSGYQRIVDVYAYSMIQ